MQRTICRGVMSASSFQSGLPSALRVEIPDGVDDGGHRQVDHAFLGPSQRSCESPASAARTAEVRDHVLEAPADDERRERVDRRDAHLVAAADREGEPVAFEPPSVWRIDVGRRVVGIRVHRVGATRGQRAVGNRRSGRELRNR